MSLIQRVERLEEFIGDIDQVKLYGNSLQEIVDKYMAPLYIESGTANVILINDYLGELSNIPRNVIFKIRASHTLDMTDVTDALLQFSRPGESTTEFQLKKYHDGLLVPLETSNYSAGIVYDVYINSQDIAIITSNDAATIALAEIEILKTRTTNLENKTEGITREEDGGYIMDKLTVTNLFVTNQNIEGDLTFGDTAGPIILPGGTTIISTPGTDTSLVNKKYVIDTISAQIDNYHSTYHITGTQEAASALRGKSNGTFYYKLEA